MSTMSVKSQLELLTIQLEGVSDRVDTHEYKLGRADRTIARLEAEIDELRILIARLG